MAARHVCFQVHGSKGFAWFCKGFWTCTNFPFHLLETTHTNSQTLRFLELLGIGNMWQAEPSNLTAMFVKLMADERWHNDLSSGDTKSYSNGKWWRIQAGERSFKVPHPSVPSIWGPRGGAKGNKFSSADRLSLFVESFKNFAELKAAENPEKPCNFLLILTPFDPRHSRIWKLSAFFDRDLTAIVSAIVLRADIKPRNEGMSQRRMSQCKNAKCWWAGTTHSGRSTGVWCRFHGNLGGSKNAIRFGFLRLNKNRGPVDLLLKNECNSGNLGERCDLFKLCCHHHWSQLWSWMWWKYDQSCQHVDPAKSRTGCDWLTLDLVTLFRENGCFQMREDARWLCTRVAICYQLLFCGVLHFGSFCSLAVGLADGEHAGKWWKQSNLRNQEIPKMGFLQNH